MKLKFTVEEMKMPNSDTAVVHFLEPLQRSSNHVTCPSTTSETDAADVCEYRPGAMAELTQNNRRVNATRLFEDKPNNSLSA